MTDLSSLCPVCFSGLEEQNICPVCRSSVSGKQTAPALPLRSMVANRYYIGKALKHNSEGITYSAYDTRTEKPCSVREFFPDALVRRDADEQTVIPLGGCEEDFLEYRGSFFALWNKLYRLRGLSSLINVNAVLNANGTMYAVYEESERYTLRDYLLDTPEGFISWEKARIMMMPVLSTLGTLHTSGIIHRGINPQAFLFSADGKLKLTDFCIEQTRTAAGDMNPELFEGYAALEQYATTGQMGTWTDIYSFSATLYRVLVGTTPIDSKTRAQNDRMMIPAKFAESLPPYAINAIINGMQLSPSDRTRNVEQLRSNLSASPKAVNASASVYPSPGPAKQAPAHTPVRSSASPVPSASNVRQPVRTSPSAERVDRTEFEKHEEEKKNRSKTAVIVILIVVVIGLVGALGLMLKNLSGGKQEETTASENMVTVPTFMGFGEDTIRANQDYNEDFVIEYITENSSTVQAGIIINQNIPANTSVAKGTVITLTVSAGKSSYVLPDYSAYTYEQAEADLIAHGITPVRGEKFNDGTQPSNVVAESFPKAGETVLEGATVQLVVWQDIDTTAEETSAEYYTDYYGNVVEATTASDNTLQGLLGSILN